MSFSTLDEFVINNPDIVRLEIHQHDSLSEPGFTAEAVFEDGSTAYVYKHNGQWHFSEGHYVDHATATGMYDYW